MKKNIENGILYIDKCDMEELAKNLEHHFMLCLKQK